MFKTTRTLMTAGLSALALAGMLTAPSVAGATSARADEVCTDRQHREFPTSGFNTDVWITLCVQDTGSSHKAAAYASWHDAAGVKKFDNFDVQVRLERYDADRATRTCDFTHEINNNSPDYQNCHSGSSSSSKYGGWTADGLVRFDLDADGNGGATWNLHGTPKIG